MSSTEKMGKTKVLIVDDRADMRLAYRNLLFFEENLEIVGMAVNGQEAITLVENLNPDLVLMDIEMPVLDGVSAIRQLRLSGSKKIIFAMSSDDHHREAATKAGANTFLNKPFSLEELQVALKAF